MVVTSVATFERFFRETAGLDIDKDDLKRHREFVVRKLNDLLIRGQAVAKVNLRDIVEPFDLPITKGLQERMREFRKTGEATVLEPESPDGTLGALVSLVRSAALAPRLAQNDPRRPFGPPRVCCSERSTGPGPTAPCSSYRRSAGTSPPPCRRPPHQAPRS